MWTETREQVDGKKIIREGKKDRKKMRIGDFTEIQNTWSESSLKVGGEVIF